MQKYVKKEKQITAFNFYFQQLTNHGTIKLNFKLRTKGE